MESIILILIGVGIFAFNYHLSNENSQPCPKCGRRGRRVGKMIQLKTGKPVFSYKCDCGCMWNSYW